MGGDGKFLYSFRGHSFAALGNFILACADWRKSVKMGGEFDVDFINDFTNPGKLAPTNISHGPNPHLTGTVAAKDGSILNQGHTAPHSRRGNRRPHPGIPTSNYHQVVTILECRSFLEPQEFPSPGGQDGRIIRGGPFT